MKIVNILVILLSFPLAVWSQSADNLIDSTNSAWPDIGLLRKSATNKVIILPATPANGRRVIIQLQQSTRSTLGAVAYHTGGILIDSGWIRILGSGHSLMKRDLAQWNKNKSVGKKFLLIADDAIGGFYLLNTGDLGPDTGNVYYLSPKDLVYKSLGTDYYGFLQFCFTGDLDMYYKGLRWKTWRTDLEKLPTDNAFVFLPFLWRDDSQGIDKKVRRDISVEEKYFLLQEEIRRKNR